MSSGSSSVLQVQDVGFGKYALSEQKNEEKKEQLGSA